MLNIRRQIDEVLLEDIVDPNIRSYIPNPEQPTVPLINPMEQPEIQDTPNPLHLPYPLDTAHEYLATAYVQLQCVDAQLKIAITNNVVEGERRKILIAQRHRLYELLECIKKISIDVEKLDISS